MNLLAVSISKLIAYMGPYKYPVIGLSVLVAILIIWCIVEKYVRKKGDGEQFKSQMTALLVTGSLTGALGLLSQIIGIWLALEAIIEAADISPAMVFRGLQMSFAAPIYGLSTTAVAGIAWVFIKYIPSGTK